jgi:hypothetical protein
MSLDIRTPDPNQAKVFEVANPDRHGKIIGAGPQQSEVRFDDGAVRIVSNVHLRPVEAPPVVDNGFSQLNPSPVFELVRLGQEAMARKRRAWGDWLAIAEAIQAGRTEVMRSLHTNEATGRRYEKAMGDWLIANGFKEINKATRSQLLDCLKHRAEIEKWRAQLTDSERFKFNHPDAVLRKWKASTVVPDPDKPKKLSPVQMRDEEIGRLLEHNDRLQREIERGGGDLWTVDDRPKDIARVMLDKLGKSKAEKVARVILAALKEATS